MIKVRLIEHLEIQHYGNMMSMRIGFIQGAGVSIPAGMPTTGKLTEEALRVHNYTLHTNQSFVREEPGIPGSRSWRTRRGHLKSFLEFVHVHCQMYFNSEKSKERDVNYEDLFFAAYQLHEHLSEEYENPAIEPFARVVLEGQLGINSRDRLKKIAGLACNYIQDVVAMELGLKPRPEPPDHLVCLVDAARDRSFDGCDVFTLNHDLLIESILEHK